LKIEDWRLKIEDGSRIFFIRSRFHFPLQVADIDNWLPHDARGKLYLRERLSCSCYLSLRFYFTSHLNNLFNLSLAVLFTIAKITINWPSIWLCYFRTFLQIVHLIRSAYASASASAYAYASAYASAIDRIIRLKKILID